MDAFQDMTSQQSASDALKLSIWDSELRSGPCNLQLIGGFSKTSRRPIYIYIDMLILGVFTRNYIKIILRNRHDVVSRRIKYYALH